ncbi:MAG: TPM domain-containing protein [Oscillospiraceae bacterium]|nr:TPM domain-containing protein [Oscillospiraceae bacterium]
MKRRTSILCLSLILLLATVSFLSQTALAESRAGKMPLIIDNAGVLSSSEISALTEKAQEISRTYACDTAVVFVRGLSGYSSIMAYTDDFFDYNGYGYNGTRDGVMLLVDVKGREYWISTLGFGIDAFTDAGQLYLKDQFVSYLSRGDWSGAADAFLSGCDRFLHQARNGNPYDIGNMPRKNFNLALLLGDVGLGVLLGGLPLHKSKKEMKNVKEQRDAEEYIYGKAPVLTQRDDRLLGRHVTRIPIPRDTGGSSGGGGSTIHVGSSGNTHGGSGGHF